VAGELGGTCVPSFKNALDIIKPHGHVDPRLQNKRGIISPTIQAGRRALEVPRSDTMVAPAVEQELLDKY